MSTDRTGHRERRWTYPLLYAALLVISMLPLYAESAFPPQDTQDVILELVRDALTPYEALAPIFHLATLVMIALVALLGERMGRLLAAYIGLNYLIIVPVQTMGRTEKYGFVVHTGATVAFLVLGIAWIVVAVRGDLRPSFRNVPTGRYLTLPLALLAFWAPYGVEARPCFDPLLLLTSPAYGLTFCFTTPVFLFLLVLFYPTVNAFAYRMTAFNGLIYGAVNMVHLIDPLLRWMGVLHLPLLILSIYALILPRVSRGSAQSRRKGTRSDGPFRE